MKKIKEFFKAYDISISIITAAMIIGFSIIQASNYLGRILFLK